MRRRFSFPLLVLLPTIGFLGAGACGVDGANVPLPYFEGGVEGGTSEAGADGGDNDGAPTDGEVTETSTDASSDGGDAGSGGATSLVLSQVQTRGSHGGNDEFVEIYNASAGPITFDNTWSVTVRNATGGVATCATALPSTLFTGSNQVIPSHGHLLFATANYSEATAADTTFSAGIPDAASLVLVHSGTASDALCFQYDAATTTTLTTCITAYTCEGATPPLNPHDNTSGTDSNASLERKPGGNGGNTTDSNNNLNDFLSNAAPDPHDLASPAVP